MPCPRIASRGTQDDQRIEQGSPNDVMMNAPGSGPVALVGVSTKSLGSARMFLAALRRCKAGSQEPGH